MVAGTCLLPEFLHADSAQPSVHFPTEPRERVAVAAYPFREYIVGWKGWDGGTPSPVPAARQIEFKDFAAHVAQVFNIHNIEPWSRVFPATDPAYLEELRTAVEKTHSAVVNIAVDEEFSQYAINALERERAVMAAKHWVDVGAAIGSPSIRTHIERAKDSKPDVERAADTLLRVVEYAQQKNVVVHLENDDPVSEDPFFIVQVIEKVNSPWLRGLPDFGNSLAAHDEDFAYRAVDAMFAHAYGICHVKDGEVNEQGKAVHVDLARTFRILKKNNYRGYCSIEYDAPGDPHTPTAELIKQTVSFLSVA